jgi:RNA polymerase sigma factor FliA
MNAGLNEYAAEISLDRNHLFESHIVIVQKIARKLHAGLPASIQLDDLIQVGLIALYESAQSYKPLDNAAFATYATLRIRGAIIDELRRISWTPRALQHKQKEISAAIRVVEQQSGKPATEADIANFLGISRSDYQNLLSEISLTSVVAIDDVMTESFVSEHDGHYEESLHKAQLIEILADLIDLLPDREKLVISLYFEHDLNLKEIGKVLDLTESRISQILTQGVSRLRARLSSRLSSPSQR